MKPVFATLVVAMLVGLPLAQPAEAQSTDMLLRTLQSVLDGGGRYRNDDDDDGWRGYANDDDDDGQRSRRVIRSYSNDDDDNGGDDD